MGLWGCGFVGLWECELVFRGFVLCVYVFVFTCLFLFACFVCLCDCVRSYAFRFVGLLVLVS